MQQLCFFLLAVTALFSCRDDSKQVSMLEPLRADLHDSYRLRDIVLGRSGFVYWEDTAIECRWTDVDIFAQKELSFSGPFDIDKAMKGLYPGNYYKLLSDLGEIRVSLWKPVGKRSIPVEYYWSEDTLGTLFPDTAGMDTRFLDTALFAGSDGRKHILFSTSSIGSEIFDPILVGRFSGGVLGLALFDETQEGWKLRCFDPAIGSFGAFSASPPPHKLLFGKDNFGCWVNSPNGGAGGPYTNEMTFIAVVNGKFRKVLQDDFNMLFNVTGGGWGTRVTTAGDGPFAELVLTTTGEFSTGGSYNEEGMGWKYATENAPEILKKEMDKGQAFGFTLTRHYTFDGSVYRLSGTDLQKSKFDEQAIDSIITWVR